MSIAAAEQRGDGGGEGGAEGGGEGGAEGGGEARLAPRPDWVLYRRDEEGSSKARAAAATKGEPLKNLREYYTPIGVFKEEPGAPMITELMRASEP